jgi:hypothetical protein
MDGTLKLFQGWSVELRPVGGNCCAPLLALLDFFSPPSNKFAVTEQGLPTKTRSLAYFLEIQVKERQSRGQKKRAHRQSWSITPNL